MYCHDAGDGWRLWWELAKVPFQWFLLSQRVKIGEGDKKKKSVKYGLVFIFLVIT